MSRHSYSHYCDDVRFEVGNKVSFMGIYGGELQVEQLPSTLPKLWIVAYCDTPVDKPFKTLSLRILYKEVPLIENVIPEDDLNRMQQNLIKKPTLDDPISRITIGMNVQISPLVIDGPSVLTTLMIADGEELLAGKLRISKVPDDIQ